VQHGVVGRLDAGRLLRRVEHRAVDEVLVPHQEINAHAGEALSCVVVRSGQEALVVNLELDEIEPEPEIVRWVDDLHD